VTTKKVVKRGKKVSSSDSSDQYDAIEEEQDVKSKKSQSRSAVTKA